MRIIRPILYLTHCFQGLGSEPRLRAVLYGRAYTTDSILSVRRCIICRCGDCGFYRAMLRRARLCYRILSVCLSVRPWRWGMFMTPVRIYRK